MLPTFELIKPRSLEEALELMAAKLSGKQPRESELPRGGNNAARV